MQLIYTNNWCDSCHKVQQKSAGSYFVKDAMGETETGTAMVHVSWPSIFLALTVPMGYFCTYSHQLLRADDYE